jgi:hypothetical protein
VAHLNLDKARVNRKGTFKNSDYNSEERIREKSSSGRKEEVVK